MCRLHFLACAARETLTLALTLLRLLPQSFDDVQAGRLPEFPTIEWYFQTTVDESMQDEHGRHNSALFVQWYDGMLLANKPA